MTKITLWACCLLVSIAGPACLALDLTPRVVHRIQNNKSFECPYFLDGTTRYGIVLPINTSISGDKGEARFTFSDAGGALFIMRPSPHKPETEFAGDNLEIYRKLALSLIPKGATEATIRQEFADPLPGIGWTAYQIIVTSKFWGSWFQQAVTFVNFSPTEQILLVTTADPQYFQQALAKSSQLLNSFHKLQPDEDLSAPVFP